ncbi:hypothetical protein M0R45_030235 [Rubus argutus]|uniref:F-box domain-containing protein n=1 Tax=Rubus argutus TaxID=59490 RepID=A0AAW1WCE3_RUBAR
MLRTKRMSQCSNNAKLMDLPVDVLINILLRLPVKSLCCTQCVSKTLLHIVEARSFATLVHLRLRNTASHTVAEVPQILLLTRSRANGNLTTILPSHRYDGNALRKNRQAIVSEFASSRYDYHVDFVFCNLFFFKDREYGGPCFLFNPLRGEVLFPPTSNIQVPTYRIKKIFIDWYGMGFDNTTSTHKIVRVSGNAHYRLVAQVYVLGTSSWKEIRSVPPCNLDTKDVSAYGDVHWLINLSSEGGQIRVVSFDFKKEEFCLTPPPTLRKPDVSSFLLQLLNLKGCMAIVDVSSGTDIEIWVLRSYEKKEWVRDYYINIEMMVDGPQYLGQLSTSSGEWEQGIFIIEYRVNTINLFFVDIRSDSVKRISIGRGEYTRILSYTGSLISLKNYGYLAEAETGNWKHDFSKKSWQFE